jgi:dihydrofolate reductase
MMSISLDGFFEGASGEIDWHLVDDELHDHFNQVLSTMSVFLNGRVTYELMARFWPNADKNPQSSRPMLEFARIWRDMPKIVFSSSLEWVEWSGTVVRKVSPEDLMDLKAQPGGDMALAGAKLAAAFAEHDLIDEYRIYVHPVLLGRGRTLFQASGQKAPLRLLASRVFGNGVVLLHYERALAEDTRSTNLDEIGAAEAP